MNKVAANGVKKAVKKVAKFCKKNKKVCEAVEDLGLKIINGESVVEGQGQGQDQPQF